MDYHTIDCRAQGLPRVPSPFPLDVRKLLIADNQVQEIPADFFIFYGDLVYLDFSNNSIAALQDGTFSGSSKLVYLDLSYNNLSQLEAGAFKTAEKLIKLSLGHNHLAELDQAAFESLEQLQVLELNDNHLQTLNVAALDVLPNLRTVRLEGNPWLCDCDFASFFSWLEQNEGKLQKGKGFVFQAGSDTPWLVSLPTCFGARWPPPRSAASKGQHCISQPKAGSWVFSSSPEQAFLPVGMQLDSLTMSALGLCDRLQPGRPARLSNRITQHRASRRLRVYNQEAGFRLQ